MYKSHKVIVKQIEGWDLFDDGLKKEIIYVDDACPNRSHLQVVEAWKKRQSEINRPIGKILINENNVGYGYACNIGAKHANGKYLIFLNADTTVTCNWIKPIYDRFEQDETIGLIGNLQLKPDKIHVDSAGSEWLWSKGTFEHIGRHSLYGKPLPEAMKWADMPPEYKKPAEREMVTGCCFAVPKKLWDNA